MDVMDLPGFEKSVEVDAEALHELQKAWLDLSPQKQERINAIRDLQRKELTNAAIAQLLNVSERTIRNDRAWVRENFERFVERFFLKVEVGEAIALHEEIINRCMDLADVTSHEQIVKIDAGGIQQKTWLQPNHFATIEYFSLVLKAMQKKFELLKHIGLINKVPQKMGVDGYYDISKINDPNELERVAAEIRCRISKIDEDIERNRQKIESKSGRDFDEIN